MQQDHRSSAHDIQKQDGTPVLEWISAAIGLVLTVAMLGFIGWQAWKRTGDEPPAIKVHVQHILPAGDGYVVEFVVVNLSPATAAAVQIEGELIEGERVIATSQVTLDYVPGNSERRGGLFFRENPQAYDLEIRALGYAKP